MKRSFSLVDNDASIEPPSRCLFQGKANNLAYNSLKADLSFVYPSALLTYPKQDSGSDQFVINSTSTQLKDNYSLCASSEEDNLTTSCTSDDEDDAFLDFLTEEWLSHDDQDTLFTGDSLNSGSSEDFDDYLDSSDDVFQQLQQPPNQQGLFAQGHNKNNLGSCASSPTAMMDQACIDYFMAEYLKVVECSSPCEYVSFADFVTVSLDMIASFKKATTLPTTFQQTNSQQSTSSFDFSIQNWQQRVVSSTTATASTTAAPYTHQRRMQEKSQEQRRIQSTVPWPGVFNDNFQFEVFDEKDTQQYHSTFCQQQY